VTRWRFEVVGVRPELSAVTPTLVFRLRVTGAAEAAPVAIALRAQVRLEPQRRRYAPPEGERLYELFGDASQWGDSMKPLLWTHASIVVPGFSGSTEVDVPIGCTYDFDVASAKYFHALEEGEIPLIWLFSGSVLHRGERGLSVEPVPWDCEATFGLPVRTWRAMMDHFFPGSAWIRLRRDSLEALHRFRGRGAYASWDAAIAALLAAAADGRAS